MATAVLEYVEGRAVYCVETDKNRYDRMLTTLYHSKDGDNINASLVCAGSAWWYEICAGQSATGETSDEGA